MLNRYRIVADFPAFESRGQLTCIKITCQNKELIKNIEVITLIYKFVMYRNEPQRHYKWQAQNKIIQKFASSV